MNLRGFTMIEVLVVVAILASIFGLSAATYSKLQQSAASAISDREIGNVLGAAARRARSGVHNSAWGVYIPYDEVTRKTTSLIIFAGNSYAARDTTKDITFPVDTEIAFTAVDFSGAAPDVMNSHEIVFAALAGTTAQYGSLTVTWYEQTSTITVPSNGIPVR